VLNFRHWLEKHELRKLLFDEVGAMLEERGLLMRQGTIVDATIIAAPPSTKNNSKSRGPEMHQTKKRNQSCLGTLTFTPVRGLRATRASRRLAEKYRIP